VASPPISEAKAAIGRFFEVFLRDSFRIADICRGLGNGARIELRPVSEPLG
jgi:hypothetical protein